MVSPLRARRVAFHGAPAEVGGGADAKHGMHLCFQASPSSWDPGGGFQPTALRIARINEQLAELQAHLVMHTSPFHIISDNPAQWEKPSITKDSHWLVFHYRWLHTS